MLQNRLAGDVAEGHVVELDIPLHVRHVCGIGFVRLFFGAVEHVKHAFRAGKRGKHRAHLHRDLVDRAGELARVVDEDGQTADVKAARDAENTADTRGQRVGNLPGVAHDRTHDAAVELRADLLFAQVVVQ